MMSGYCAFPSFGGQVIAQLLHRPSSTWQNPNAYITKLKEHNNCLAYYEASVIFVLRISRNVTGIACHTRIANSFPAGPNYLGRHHPSTTCISSKLVSYQFWETQRGYYSEAEEKSLFAHQLRARRRFKHIVVLAEDSYREGSTT